MTKFMRQTVRERNSVTKLSSIFSWFIGFRTTLIKFGYSSYELLYL